MTLVLNLSLFGSLRVTLGEAPAPGLTSAKAQALLCYLAVTGHAHSRQALAGLLWGDLPEADARRNLRGVVMRLREELEPYLQITYHALTFDFDSPHQLDVAEFRAATQKTAVPHLPTLRRAISLYRGDFLEDFHLRQAPAFEEWLLAERHSLRRLMVETLQTLTAVSLQQATYEDGLTYARRWLSLEPTDEAAHRQLMRLLTLNGQRSAALNQYDHCRHHLQYDLGIEPAAETTLLRDQIRANTMVAGDWSLVAGQAVPAPSPPVRLSHPAPPPFIAGPPITHPANFFGRERELKRLFHLLRGLPLQNAAIVGPRRSGKTSLLHYMRQIGTAVPQQLRPGQFQNWLPNPHLYRWVFVDFQDTRLGDPTTLLQYLLSEMGLSVPTPCHLDQFLDVVSDELQVPTIILFDEIGVALSRYPALDDSFWESLRSLATNQVGGRLAFILAGAEAPGVLANQSGHGSPFFNIFGYVAALGPLKETEARELVANAPRPFPAADVDWIIAASGGWPMPLQILCRERLLALEEGDAGSDWRAEALRQIAPFMTGLSHEDNPDPARQENRRP
jgi:DNA-binding SARP family transcriptional activator